jgi:hypothetical protein
MKKQKILIFSLSSKQFNLSYCEILALNAAVKKTFFFAFASQSIFVAPIAKETTNNMQNSVKRSENNKFKYPS